MNNPDTYILTSPRGELLLGDIAPLEALEAMANDEDRAAVAEFSAPSRRAERLAWRIMLRRRVGSPIEVEYSTEGAPRIKNLPYAHISVSHCHDKVAVALSKEPCTVDIESLTRDFQRLAPRYMNESELAMAHDNATRAAIWCGKEALYKLAGRRGLDLRCDINITSLDLAQGTLTGRVAEGAEVEMKIIRPDQMHIVVYRI